MGTPAKHNIKIAWSSHFAYAIGLIASDGCLSKNVPRINFGSKEIEMMENFRQALGLENKIGRHARGGEREKKYFYVNFKSRRFYDHVLAIGLAPAKSKTIKLVAVPDEYFADFFRGVFDGDGSFYTFWDRRWPNSFGFQMTVASASIDFLHWLQRRLHRLYDVKGYMVRGSGVYIIRYAKSDTRTLSTKMYHGGNLIYLKRKYEKIREALELDELIKERYNPNRQFMPR